MVKIIKTKAIITLSLFLSAFATYSCSSDNPSANLSTDEIIALAADAYVYGLAPVIVAQKTFDQTNSTSSEAVYAPINELFIDTQINTPESALWVSPNVNVLYSSAHLDLTEEPMVLFTPSIQDRYFSWEIMDAYTNAFSYIGSRATGGMEGTFALVGPDFVGMLPEGVTKIQCPTNSVWIVNRTEVQPGSQSDLDTVISLVQSSVLLPLSEFFVRDPNYVNPIIEHPTNTVPELDITGLNFFTVLNDWITKNPPPPADDPTLARIAKIGIGPGFDTNFKALSADVQAALLEGMRLGEVAVEAETFLSGTIFNGWVYHVEPNFGNWGTAYLLRAGTARGALGANIVEEAVYPLRLEDQDFLPLTGGRNYTLTLTADLLPVPVNQNGFWSLTLYDLTTGRLVANPIDRYSLGSQNELTVAADGSITIYVQRDQPTDADQVPNWLPSPQNSDPFYLLFRAYYPDPSMYTPDMRPDYTLPQFKRVD